MCVRCACSHVCVCVFVCTFMCVNMGVPVHGLHDYQKAILAVSPQLSPGLRQGLFVCLCCAAGKLTHKLPGILLSHPSYHLTVDVLDCRCLGEDAAFNWVLSTQPQVLTFVRLGILFIEPSSPQPLIFLPNVHFGNPCQLLGVLSSLISISGKGPHSLHKITEWRCVPYPALVHLATLLPAQSQKQNWL